MGTIDPQKTRSKDSAHKRHQAPEFNSIKHQTAEHHLRSDWDVHIPAPTDGQVLTYDAASKQWVADDAAGASVFSGYSEYKSGISVTSGSSADSSDDIGMPADTYWDTDAYFGNGMDVQFSIRGMFRVHIRAFAAFGVFPTTGSVFLEPYGGPDTTFAATPFPVFELAYAHAAAAGTPSAKVLEVNWHQDIPAFEGDALDFTIVNHTDKDATFEVWLELVRLGDIVPAFL